MEHILDIETTLFRQIQEHETVEMEIPSRDEGREIKPMDTLKLYHPGEEIEALRIEVESVEKRGENGEKNRIEYGLAFWSGCFRYRSGGICM